MATKLKKSFKKSPVFLNGPAFSPPPPTLNGLAICGGTFFCFCGFPYTYNMAVTFKIDSYSVQCIIAKGKWMVHPVTWSRDAVGVGLGNVKKMGAGPTKNSKEKN